MVFAFTLLVSAANYIRSRSVLSYMICGHGCIVSLSVVVVLLTVGA